MIAVTHMPTHRRKFTDEEKLEIMKQATLSGVTSVLRQHNLSYSVYAKWKEKFDKNDKRETEQYRKSEVNLLLEENKRLKKIVAGQALIIEQKSEEIRKIKDRHNLK